MRSLEVGTVAAAARSRRRDGSRHLSTDRGTPGFTYSSAMSDLVYPPVLAIARTMFLALGIRFDIQGAENIPRGGPAVLASNHVSYLDFTFVGLAARPSRRLVRFMAKEAVFTNRVSGPLMRGMHHIPVDRAAGATSFRAALGALKAGEVIGVFPEATISRSFMLKEFKSGTARMAQASGAPIVPMALWGGQRIYTKGHPRDLTRGRAVTMAVGEPFSPGRKDDSDEVTAELVRRMTALLDGLQRSYPQQPASDDDRWWIPAALGGTAPTPEQAAELDAADALGRPPR